MSREAQSQAATYGYLSTWESQDHGCVGGYLVVSELGRPLEFHCTAPFRPSRAQEILFGPTLRPYLFGEQIGGTLLRAAKLRSRVVLVDHLDVLWLRGMSGIPLVYLSPQSDQASGEDDPVFVAAQAHESDLDLVQPLLERLRKHVDLTEPFARIREAIHEAHRLGAKSSEAHEQAA